jgi:ribulose 1,5-bisphosphate synthetase/thiazole synthase
MASLIDNTVTEPARELPVFRKVDVAVIGGGSAGYPAAIAAARAGASVLLIERQPMVGGTGPNAFVTEFLSCENLSGIMKEVAERLGASGGATQQFRPEYFNLAFDPDSLRLVILDLLEEAGASILLNSWVTDVVMDDGPDGKHVKGVIVENKSGRQAVLADVVIDASGDADVAARAGVAMQPKESLQPMMMLFRCGGVDWRGIEAYARANPQDFSKTWGVPPGSFDGAKVVHCSGWHSTVADGKAKGLLPKDFGTNLSVFGATPANIEHSIGYIYAVPVLNRDPADAVELSAAEIEGRKSVRAILPFLKTVPGLENAFLIDIAPQIGVRDSRRIVGDVILTRDDIFAEIEPADTIALKVHRGPDVKGWVRHPADGKEGEVKHRTLFEGAAPFVVVTFGIPYRCLLPIDTKGRGVEGLLVAGKTVSFDNEAHARCRLMPECIAMGEAAGTAAAMAAKAGVSPRQVDVAALRQKLTEGGANLDRNRIDFASYRALLEERGYKLAN